MSYNSKRSRRNCRIKYDITRSSIHVWLHLQRGVLGSISPSVRAELVIAVHGMDFEIRFLVFSGRKPFLDSSLLGVHSIKGFLPLGLAFEESLYFSLDAAWLVCSHDSPCIFDDTISLAFTTRTVQILLARAAVDRSPSSSNNLRLARLLCGAQGYCSFIQWPEELA